MFEDIEMKQIKSPISSDCLFIFKVLSENVTIKVEKKLEMYFVDVLFQDFDDEFNKIEKVHRMAFSDLGKLKVGLFVFLEKHIKQTNLEKLDVFFEKMYYFL